MCGRACAQEGESTRGRSRSQAVPRTSVAFARVAAEIVQPTPHGVGVRFDGVGKVFSENAGVVGIDSSVAPGACLAFMGASGCGKTTLIRMAAGLEAPTSGRVVFLRGGQEVPAHEVEIGVCFQDPRLLPWRSALRNVALPLELRGVPRREAKARAQEALVRVGLGDWGRVLPSRLSGGMRMRVGLARALVNRPSVLLLDEPCSALDIVTRVEIEDHIGRLKSELGITVILVTHSIEEAAFLADRVCMLAGAPATIAETLEIGHASRGPSVRDSGSFGATLTLLMQSLHSAARRKDA